MTILIDDELVKHLLILKNTANYFKMDFSLSPWALRCAQNG
jgi:hypothetical protein